MGLSKIDTIVTNQLLLRGTVRDGLSSLPLLRVPSVDLFYQASASRPVRPYPLAARLYPSGHFIFAGSAQSAFPHLAAGETLALRLAVTAAGYQTRTHDFTLDATQLQRQPTTIVVEGKSVSFTQLNVPLLEHDFDLFPLPVHLSGRIVEADNRDKAIANAEVRLTAPSPLGPVSSNGEGFFTLQSLPIASSVTVRVTRAGFVTLEESIRLDYRYPVNEHLFALTT